MVAPTPNEPAHRHLHTLTENIRTAVDFIARTSVDHGRYYISRTEQIIHTAMADWMGYIASVAFIGRYMLAKR